ncbi:MAG TPA: type II toxin-antitoxin system PemK/MazF family toxin, partial [Cytophagaceae bacterium]|nr:type II toxin-antitoxin system PemK/MazF family toxin [Cytophagaceae bacterium]
SKKIQGEIWRVEFPYTETPNKSKERPALIVSNNASNKNKVIMAYITTVEKGEYAIEIPIGEQVPPTLVTCEVRTNRLFTADKKVLKTFECSVKKDFLEKVLAQVKSHF